MGSIRISNIGFYGQYVQLLHAFVVACQLRIVISGRCKNIYFLQSTTTNLPGICQCSLILASTYFRY